MWEGDSQLVQVGISQKSGGDLWSCVVITSVLIRREKDGRAVERMWVVCFFKGLVRGSIYGVGRRDEVGWKGEVVISLLSI